MWILQTVNLAVQTRHFLKLHLFSLSNLTYRKSKLKCDNIRMRIHQHTAGQDQTVFNKMTITINEMRSKKETVQSDEESKIAILEIGLL